MSTEAAPDPAATADLACPLCGYNLRGLVDPRCPECGFTFRWAELLDAKRTRHPWLFEHGRGRSVRTLLATYARTALPDLFWKSVTPANPVHVGRLLMYALIAAVVPLLPTIVSTTQLGVQLARSNSVVRATYAPIPGRPGFFTGPPSGYANLFTSGRAPPPPVYTSADVNAAAPWPVSAAFRDQWFVEWRTSARPSMLRSAALVLAWPWLTVSALLIFQGSMRRARVGSRHVLRAAIYGCDFGLLLCVVTTLPITWVVPTCAGVASYRVSVAYGQYLRFDRPFPTAVAAQVVVVLCALIAIVRWG